MTSSYPPPGIFKGTNIMTPNIVAYFPLGDGVWAELSSGRGPNHEPLWGVTVEPKEKRPGASKLCFSRADAYDYINSLTHVD